MKHAVSIPPFAPVETLISMAVDAEEAGWDGVFYWDHSQAAHHARPPEQRSGIPADEYAGAGTTWLVEGTWPHDDWADQLHAAIHHGPSR